MATANFSPKITRYFFAFAVAFTFIFAHPSFAADRRCEVILSGKFEIYHPAIGTGQIKIMSTEEFIRKSIHDEHSPLDIVVVPALPTDMKPELLGGVISGTRLSPNSHMEVQAQKQGIPFVYWENADQDPTLIQLSKSDGVHELTFKKNENKVGIKSELTSKEVRDNRLRGKVHIEQIIPNRGNPGLVLMGSDFGFYDAHVLKTYGPKPYGFWRATSRGMFGGIVPKKSSALSFGSYFEYLARVAPPGYRNLDEAIQKEVTRLIYRSAPVDEVKRTLNQISTWFDILPIPRDLLERYHSALENIYGDLNQSMRGRTSANMENDIGAGVNDSFVFNLGETKEEQLRNLDLIIRKIYKSQYEFKAYNKRRFFSIEEKNVAMAILFHPDVSGETWSGVASFDRDFGSYIADLVIHPQGSSATSPKASAIYQTIQLRRKFDSEKVEFSFDRVNFKPLSRLPKYSWLSKEESYGLINVFDTIYHTWWIDVPSYAHTKINFEWLLRQYQAVLLDVKGPTRTDVVSTDYSKDISPNTLSNYLNHKTVSPEEYQALDSMAVYPIEEILARKLTHYSWSEVLKTGKISFCLIEVQDKKMLFFSDGGRRFGTGHRALDQGLTAYFGEDHFKYLEIGTMEIDAVEQGDHFEIKQIGLSPTGNSPSTEVNTIGADRNAKLSRDLVLELLKQLVVPDLVTITKKTMVYGEERFNQVIPAHPGVPLSKYIQIP